MNQENPLPWGCIGSFVAPINPDNGEIGIYTLNPGAFRFD